MSKPPDNFEHITLGLQRTPGTPASPQLYPKPVRYSQWLMDNDAQYAAWAANPPPVDVTDMQALAGRLFRTQVQGQWVDDVPDPDWTPIDADPWAPAAPRQYCRSDLAAERAAVFVLEEPQVCARCAQIMTDFAVQVAPPGLPRMTVHLRCLEAGDAVQPRPEAP